MKIAYVMSHNISKNDGVVRKVIEQSEEWRRLGADVQVFAVTPSGGTSTLNCSTYDFTGAFSSRLVINSKLIKDIKLFKPDFIYFRYDVWNRNIIELSKTFPLIIEANTNDVKEATLQFKSNKNLKSLIRLATKLVLHKLLLKKASGVVAVTQEIYEDAAYKNYIPSHVIVPNGISIDKYQAKELVDKRSRPSLFFIGSPNQAWHGVDKIKFIAEKLPEFDFNLVGIDGKNTQNCFFHGYLNISEYDSMMRKSSVAIGSLALYRNGLTQACPLKVREYLVNALPVIVGYQESALKNKPKWGLELDRVDDESIISIRNFVYENQFYSIPIGELESIDIKVLEQKRFDFFKTFLQES